VKNELHTISTGQTTHQDSVKKSGLRRIVFDKSCLRHILSHWKSGLRHILFIKHLLLNHSVMHLISTFFLCLPIHRRCKCFKLQYSLITTTQLVQNSNEESVHPQALSNQTSCPRKYKSHNRDTNSIPKQFIRNNFCQDIQKKISQLLDLPVLSWLRLDAVTTLLTRSELILVH